MDKMLKAVVIGGAGLVARKWLRDQVEKQLRSQGVDPDSAEFASWAIIAFVVWAFSK